MPLATVDPLSPGLFLAATGDASLAVQMALIWVQEHPERATAEPRAIALLRQASEAQDDSDAGAAPVIEALLALGAKPGIRDGDGGTPLQAAARHGLERCARILLPVSDLGAVDNRRLDALMVAAFNGRERLVELLLPLSDPLARDRDGRSALSLAAKRGHAECARLLAPKSDVGALDDNGETAFLTAAWCANVQCVKALLPFADVRQAAADGSTALHRAASWGKTDILRLLAPICDAAAIDMLGRTALMVAATNGNAEAVRELLPHSDPRARDRDGLDAFGLAIREGRDSCVPILLPAFLEAQAEPPAAFADPAQAPVHPLILAAAHGRLDCLRTLLAVCDASALHAPSGLDAFGFALLNREWACADELGAHVAVDRVARAVGLAPAEAMPLSRALVERAQLVESAAHAGEAALDRRATPRL
jgi:ankyrin repeat protein